MRKHPLSGILHRVAEEDYRVPNMNFTIPKGMRIIIPVYAIHHDEEYFPNPDRFDPDRFDPKRFASDVDKKLFSQIYMPFGAGEFFFFFRS